MKKLFNTDEIVFLILKRLGYQDSADLYENFFIKAFIDSFQRIDTTQKLEEKIRDSFIRDLETQNPMTKDFIEDKFLALDWEKWINVSDTEKSRADICLFMSGFEFVIECKRLKAAETAYLEEGILRFVEEKYAQKDNYAGMIGFIIGGKPKEIIKKLKAKVKDFYPSKDIEDYLAKTCAGYDLSFQSKHSRITKQDIQLFHVFFDLRG